MVACARRLEVLAIPDVPIIAPGDDLAKILVASLRSAGLQNEDVVVLTSKIASRAENRFVDLASVVPSDRAVEVARVAEKDPRIVQLILDESSDISRLAKNVLIVRHRLGFVGANAGIDASNARPPNAEAEGGPWVLLLPRDPDATCRALREAIQTAYGVRIAVVMTDSLGRPFRIGTVGCAIGCAGLPPLFDQRGRKDLYGRTLEITVTALADQVAAAADLVSGQADEARPLTIVRGLSFEPSELGANALLRSSREDLYA